MVSIAFRRSPRSGPAAKAEDDRKAAMSPLPFGVHRVPVETLKSILDLVQFGLHCLSAFTAFRSLEQWAQDRQGRIFVSIAFRRSPRSGRLIGACAAVGVF